MIRKLSPILPAIVLGLCPSAFGLEIKSETMEKARSELRKAVADGQVVAASHLVVVDGKPVYHEVVGLSDSDDKSPFKADSIVRIYSMSKALTSVAAMTLFDQGKFQLDDPVSKYIPAFAKTTVLEKDGDSWKTVPAKRQITVRDLFRHTSGYSYGGEPQYKDTFAREGLKYGPPMGMYPPGISLEKAAEAWARIPAVDHPGSRFIYGLNTDLLGRLVEVWSGKTLDVYMQEAICKPLEMVDTGFSIPAEKRSRFASCHTVKDGKAVVVDKGATSQFCEGFGFLSGGGGMVSTMSDYANFCQMLVDGGSFRGRTILKPETHQEMFTNQMKDAAGPMQFGLGFAINDVKLGSEQKVDKQFSWAGYATTDFRVLPGQKMFQIYLRQHLPSAYEFNRKQMDLIQTGLVLDKSTAPMENKVAGTWQLEYELEGNQVTDHYEFKASKTGELTGKLVRAGATVATLEKIKLEGLERNKVSFSAKGNREGTDWTADFEGTITGDEIEGSVKIGFNGQTYDLPWKPKRLKSDSGK
ncbi:MAG: serine hydrolase [Planctomycetota bacterium]|nr:serine hydrolase [Planctomycetota bacterium]